MDDIKIIDITPENIAEYGVCGYKDVDKHLELRKKIEWFVQYYPKGLRIKTLISNKGGYQGMLEYIPGKYAHRPVDAKGYMFIHCLFVGFKKEFKGKGYASLLIDACIDDAKENKMLGVAVVTRKGSFMADNSIFIKKGFQSVEKAKPDFELLALKFDEKSKDPSFKHNREEHLKEYHDGLTILRSAQCPYTEKNVNAIIESANKMKLKTKLVDLTDAEAVQNTPGAFGTFSIIYNGKIISHHPISNTRFENIMKEEINTLIK
ncbi:MAG: YoaP domain-containing protein [Salinivirgaceae bacterium]|jgi:N-acetylglutamate synthase-like GNAT family acetyltransferase